MAPCGAGAQVEAACAARVDAQISQLPQGQAVQAGGASQFLFTDIMTSDILVHFMRDKAFFRVAILSHELQSAAKVIALAYVDKMAYAWRLLNAAAYHTFCKGCMQYVLRADILPPVQYVCIPHPPIPPWKLMLKESGLLQRRADICTLHRRVYHVGFNFPQRLD